MMSTTQGFLARLRGLFQAGVQFGGKRDLYAVYGWMNNPQHRDFLAKYQHQGMARRIIDQPVKALWADPPKLEGDDVFNAAWQDVLAKVEVWHALIRLDKLAGLGKFAIMVCGFDGQNSLSSPVTQKVGRQLLYLQPYGEGSVDILKYDEDNTSPRFGRPLVYKVSPGSFEPERRPYASQGARLGTQFDVHHSHVLHIAEGALENTVIGSSRLEPVFNELDDLMKITGGSAETFWLTANRGLHINIDKDLELDEDSKLDLADEIEDYQHQIRRVIRTRGVEIDSLGSDVPDPSGNFDCILSLISATTGIPKRVLMGAEAGQLASQQDRANWAIQVEERIAEYGEPIVLLPFIRLMVMAGVLPPPTKLNIKWPDAFKMNPLERGQTSAQMARSAANLSKSLMTIEELNQLMKTGERPVQKMPAPAFGGGPFGANASQAQLPDTSPSGAHRLTIFQPPLQHAEAPAKTPAKTPAKGGVPAKEPTVVEPIEEPPLIDEERPLVIFLTEEECREIIGFGKHPPIFDETDDTANRGKGEASSDTPPG